MSDCAEVAEGVFFSADELRFLKEFLNLLLPPEPASPGAEELDLVAFVDKYVASSRVEEQQRWQQGIASIDALTRSLYGAPLHGLNTEERFALMERLYEARGHEQSDVGRFALAAKAVGIKAYYRTEHGLHNELKVPRPSRPAGQNETPAAIRIPPRTVSECDVVVVGSGATGGWAAKELTEAGFSVLVLESGASLAPDEHSREKRLPYQLPLRNMLDADWQFKERQPVQSKVWACDEYSQKFFVDDIDNPYETPDKKDFIWVQGSRVGGRMNVWGRQVYRYSDADFKAADIDGFGENWPISYSDLAPFYDEVEEFIGVSGSTEGLPHLPDGKFLPPMELTDGEKILKERVEARWSDRKVIIGRTATLTAPHRGRSACHYCGSCYRGCPTFSFFDSVSHTLSAAAQTGKLSITSDALVTKVLVDQKTKLASGVEYVDKNTGAIRTVKARAVVLAASTIGSTRILLNSRSEALPGGIGGSSNALGKYLHGHTHSISVVGTVPWLKKPPGTHDEGRPNQIYIPRFTNLDSSQATLPFIRGYGIEGAVKHYMTPRDITTRPGFGVKLKHSIRADSTAARFFLTAFGTMLPRAENTVSLSDRTDAWGVPTVTIDCTYGSNDLEMARHMAKSVGEMAEAAGFEVTASNDSPGTPGQCVHEVGTARMGTDPTRSVLDRSNRAWDVTNVVVVDGACFVSSGPQNPTLTMMAIALRASRELAKDLRSSS